MTKPTRFRLRRLSRGWRLRDLETRTGLPESTLSRIERAEQTPTFAQLSRLAAAFDVPPNTVAEELHVQGLPSENARALEEKK